MDNLQKTVMISLTAQLESEFVNWLTLEKDYQPKTISSHLGFYHVMSRYLKGQPFNLQTAKEFTIYLRQQEYKRNSRSNAAYTIRILSRFLAEKYQGFVDFSKSIAHVKREAPIIETLTNSEITKILTLERVYKIKKRKQFWFLLLSLLARTGRRVSEIKNLQIEDINFEDSSMLMRKPKNKQPRWIPIPADLCTLLKVFCSGKKREYIFEITWKGKPQPVSASHIRNELYARQKLAKIDKKCNPHKFRHSFPAELFRRRIPLPLVADLLGHEDWRTTERYTHLMLDDLRGASNVHTLNQLNTEPKEVVKQFIENIKQFPFEDNTKFDYIKVKRAIDEFTTQLYQSIVEPVKSY